MLNAVLIGYYFPSDNFQPRVKLMLHCVQGGNEHLKYILTSLIHVLPYRVFGQWIYVNSGYVAVLLYETNTRCNEKPAVSQILSSLLINLAAAQCCGRYVNHEVPRISNYK